MTRPALRLVVSRPAPCLARPSPEICRAVADTMAERFRTMWLPVSVGPSGVVDLLSRYVVEVRGFVHRDDVVAIVGDALHIIAGREAAARAAFRRPPRRRRPRVVHGEQFALPFEAAA